MSLQQLDGQVDQQTQSLAKQFHLALEQAQAQLLGQTSITSPELGLSLDLGQVLALGGGTGQNLAALVMLALGEQAAAGESAPALDKTDPQALAGKLVQQPQAGVADAAAQGAVNTAAGNNNASANDTASPGQTGLGGVQAATDRPVTQTQDGGGLNFFGQNQAGAAQEATSSQPTLPAYVVRQVGSRWPRWSPATRIPCACSSSPPPWAR